tara:strand:+ start:13218 stop:13415 length:198 start_codon:yes stop_codon:yes gene_type:complete
MELNLQTIMLAVTSSIAAASAIAAITPTPKDDQFVDGAKRWVSKAYRILDLLALNVGKAKQTGKK